MNKTISDAVKVHKGIWSYNSRYLYFNNVSGWFVSDCKDEPHEISNDEYFVCTREEFEFEIIYRKTMVEFEEQLDGSVIPIDPSEMNIDNCCNTACNKILLCQQIKELQSQVTASSEIIRDVVHYLNVKDLPIASFAGSILRNAKRFLKGTNK